MRVPAARVVAVVVLLCASLVPALIPRSSSPAQAVAQAACPVGRELIVNGSFEDPGLPVGLVDPIAYTATGWEGEMIGVPPTYFLAPFVPHTGNVLSGGGGIGIQQSLPVTPDIYGATLRFRMSALRGLSPLVYNNTRRLQLVEESPDVYTATFTAPIGDFISVVRLIRSPVLIDDVSVTVESCPANLPPLFDTSGIPPVIAPASGPDGAIVTFPMPTARDYDAGDTVVVTCDPGSGSRFPVGVTTVTCTASDGKDYRTTSFRVIVGDTNPPILPGDLGVFSTGVTANGAYLIWALFFAEDPEEGLLPTECDKEPGTFFPLGILVITCTATDSSGNVATRAYAVAVGSTDRPTFDAGSVANLTVPATSNAGAAVSFAPTASGPEGNVLPVTCDRASGSTFPIGTTTVTCTATSLVEVTASTTFTVTVTPNGYREPRPDRPGASAPATATPPPVATERPARPTRPGVTATPPPATATPRPTRAPRG